METKQKKDFYIGFCGILLVILSSIVCLIYALVTDNLAGSPIPAKVKLCGEYKLEGGVWEPIEDDTFIPGNKGDVFLRGTLYIADETENFIELLSNGMECTFYFNHINAKILVPGQKEHIFDVENPQIGNQACAKNWINYTYTGCEGDVVEFVIHNPHKFGNGNAVNQFLDSMYLGNTIMWQDRFVNKGYIERTIGFSVVIIAFIILGVALFATILKIKNIKRLWYMALISFFASGCFIFSSENVVLWNKKATFDNYMLIISLMLMMFFSICLIRDLFCGKTKKVGSVVAYAIGFSDIILFLLVCMEKINVYDILFPFVIINFILCLVMIVCCVFCLKKRISKKERCMVISSMIFLMAIELDSLGIGLLWWHDFYLTKFLFIIIFLIGTFAAIIEIPKYFAISLKTAELEKELQQHRLSTMISQIQPHFIFNSLSTIMYLYEENPIVARETLEKFSFFLRGTLEAIEQKECVSINYELDIVKNYLYIEKQRFGDKLEIEYDIHSEDFLIPILSIQPIVENAVRHGIRKRKTGGKVTISTYSEEIYHVVRIKDDGVGFEEEVVNNSESVHVGIKNVKERVKIMVNGFVDVESEIDLGTEVIIKIPRK